MVFTILAEFHVPTKDVTELAFGVGCAPIHRVHLDGMPVGHMLVDGGTSINILSLSLFKKLSHIEGDLERTNLSLSGFAVDPMEAKGIIYKELIVRSKTVPMPFFVVDVKGCYNMLLGRDWIHTNECVPSTLHQCII
jgi:hypothetical protein